MADGHIQSYLDGLTYPASKDEVLDTLKKNNAPSWMIDTADKMGDSYSSFGDVTTTYDHYGSPFDAS